MHRKALLVVSFGTSYHDTLEQNIGAIETAIAAALPGRVLRRAFTSGTILRKLAARDGVVIDDVIGALERLLGEGFTDVLVQPTHMMNGDEYEKLCRQAAPFAGRFERLTIGRPLLDGIEDYKAAAAALLDELPGATEGTALVLMGHGTEHFANAAYAQLEYVLHDVGRRDVLIGTVEGYPGLPEVLRRLEERPGVRRTELYPLMVVAGDHARNDLAGDGPDSWRGQLAAAGYDVTCHLRGLGEYPGVRALFAAHGRAAEEEKV